MPKPTPPYELTVPAQLLDTDLTPLDRITIRFSYDPADPYALHFHLCDPSSGVEVPWVGAREAFILAVLWGIELPGADLTVQPVLITTSGSRQVPHIRIGMYPSHPDDIRKLNGRPMYADIRTTAVRPYFTQLRQIVPLGHEHQALDIDGLISKLLGREAQR